MELSIIIVNFNTKDYLKKCLDSIDQNVKGINFEIIVVDNASDDDSASFIKENFPNVVLVENDRNLGFAKGVNQGLREARGEYVFLINPDTQVGKDTLKKLIDFAKKEKNLGAVGPKLINSDGSVQPSCYHEQTALGAIKEFWFGQQGTFEKYIPKSDKPVKVDAVVGAAMLIPRKTFDKVGFFDERYFLYYEDLDWCRRTQNLGFNIFWLPDASLVHGLGVSSKALGSKANKLLIQSSKEYNGFLKYWLLTTIIKIGQILFGK